MGLEAHVSSRVVTLGVSTGSHSSCDPVGTEVDGISPAIPKSYIMWRGYLCLPLLDGLYPLYTYIFI